MKFRVIKVADEECPFEIQVLKTGLRVDYWESVLRCKTQQEAVHEAKARFYYQQSKAHPDVVWEST